MDVAALEALVARFIARDPSGTWPEHPLFGPLTGLEWGVFSYRHFDHHLRQFGAGIRFNSQVSLTAAA
jgi:hypothetical protein